MSPSDRLVYLVEGSSATPAIQVSLAEAGLKERQDLQEWVVAHPEVIGRDVRIITIEYDKWSTDSGTQAHQRLDVLALDHSGRLVVVELKRESSTDIHLQALTYAALVARFTPPLLAEVHAEFLSRRVGTTTPAQALELIREHIEGDLDPDVLGIPRIVLVAANHPPQVVTTVAWLCDLTEHKLDIELRTVLAWRIGSQLAVQFDCTYPVAGIDDLLLSPTERTASTATIAEKVTEAARSANAVRRIVERGLLKAGDKLTLKATVEVPADVRAAVDAWVEEDPRRGSATWVEDPVRPLRWEFDDQLWRATSLVRHILKEASGLDRGPRGTTWWITDEGQDLAALAFGPSGRDWTDVHELIDNIRPGEWTSYGELAQVVGVPAISIGQHIANCDACPTGAHRVVTSSGRPSEGFRWTEASDTRSCRDALESEGISFDPDGRASKDQVVSGATLQQRRKSTTPGDEVPSL
jgi:alkylated DNA nucleotide flippase Atl1